MLRSWVFTVFDDLVDHYSLEKVKTIGDAYMVVGGMPERSDDHPARVIAKGQLDGFGLVEVAQRGGGYELAGRV